MGFYTTVIVLILVVCVVLVAVVLLQNSKGGGLAANFSAPNQILGVRKATENIEKLTWWLFAILLVLSLTATALIPHHDAGQDASQFKDLAGNVQNASAPTMPEGTAPMEPVEN